MATVTISEARTHLSKLVAAVERGTDGEVIILRRGQPVARILPLAKREKRPVVIGIAAGLFEAPPFPDGMDEEVAALFYGEDD